MLVDKIIMYLFLISSTDGGLINTGELSFSSRTLRRSRAEPDLGGLALSVATTRNIIKSFKEDQRRT